jgi:hypothetical protein
MKQKLINYARSCHFDGLIAIKEVKGKRWMAILDHIENKGNFSIDDYKSLHESWKQILKTINSMNDEEIDFLHHLKYNI